MTIFRPDGVPTRGAENVIWVPALLAPATPTLDELTGPGSLQVGGAMTGPFEPTSEQATGPDNRLSDRDGGQILGRVTLGMGAITYAYDPQLVGQDHEQTKHYDTLVPMLYGYYVDRRGLDARIAIEAGQIVDVYYGQLGERTRTPLDVASDGTQLFTYSQIFAVAQRWQDCIVAAAA